MKISSLFLISVFFLNQTQAQQANQFNSWWTYFGNYKVAEKWYITSIYSWNRSNFVENWQQSLLRIGVNYKPSKNFETGLGYDWVDYFPYGEQPFPKQITEHRTFEQIVLRHEIQNIQFIHTYRLEQRMNSDYFRNRIRYRLSVRIPLISKGDNPKLNLRFFDEVHINFGKQTQGHYFAQNRAGGVFEIPLNKALTVGIGYLNQYIIKSNKSVENNHTFTCELVHNLDFTKQKE